MRQESTETPPAGTPGAVRTTRWRYHPTGLMAGMTSPEGVELSYHYDERSRLLRMRDNLGQEQRYEYDLYGNIVRRETTNSDGSPALRMRQVYDERNRLIEMAMPHVGESESIIRYTLDAESNVIAMTDPNGAQSSSIYDRVDRLSSYTHRLNGVTEYEYDTRDRIIRVVAPNGVVTEYDYDVLARVSEERSPDRGPLRYEYDLANNVIAIREGRGIVMRYRYDELERRVEASYPNTHPGKDEQVRYRYDSCPLGLGRLCERHDESGRTAYRYDVWGNVVEREHEELGVRYHTRYSWDREDKLSRMELPSGRVVEYSRDGVRRLLGLQARLNGERRPIVSELRYRGDNRMRSYRYGNGQQDQRSYDRQGRLLVQRLTGAEDLQTDARSYRYDANGNIVDLNGSYERNRYAYDALDRLDSDRMEEEAAQGYTYDLNGNRLGAPVEEDDTRYDYLAGSNRLQASEERRGPEAASFAPRADRRLEYNDAGRLWRLYEGEGADKPLRAEYIYNGIGQRTRKIVHEAEGRRRTTIYHYDLQGMLITETRADGSVLRDYLWANAQPVAQIDKQAEQERITYLYPDHLMTPRLGMDETGTVVWRWEGEAFGQSGAEQDPDGDGREVVMRLRFRVNITTPRVICTTTGTVIMTPLSVVTLLPM